MTPLGLLTQALTRQWLHCSSFTDPSILRLEARIQVVLGQHLTLTCQWSTLSLVACGCAVSGTHLFLGMNWLWKCTFVRSAFIPMVCMRKYFIWQLACVKASRRPMPRTSSSHSPVYMQHQINQRSKRFVCVYIDWSSTVAIMSLCTSPSYNLVTNEQWDSMP